MIERPEMTADRVRQKGGSNHITRRPTLTFDFNTVDFDSIPMF